MNRVDDDLARARSRGRVPIGLGRFQPGGVPPESIVATYDAACEAGFY